VNRAIRAADQPKFAQVLAKHRDIFTQAQLEDLFKTSITYNQGEIVRMLIDAGIDPNSEFDGVPWLYIVARSGQQQIEIARALIDGGADVNAKRRDICRTALKEACYEGDIQMVEYLLDAGADLSVAHYNDTVIFDALHKPSLLKILLERGAEIHSSLDGVTPLMRAAEYGFIEAAEVLLAAGVDVNEQNRRGQTALMRAALSSQKKIILFLFEHGADPMIKDDQGDTVESMVYEDKIVQLINKLKSEK